MRIKGDFLRVCQILRVEKMKSTKEPLYIHNEIAISYRRKAIFSIIALSIIIFSIYGNSFDCSWNFDDKPNITDNPNLHLKEFSWDNIKRALFSDRRNPDSFYRPVACLSFALNYYLGGPGVFGFHLVNIFIHLLSSVFLFFFIYNTLHLPLLKAKYASKSYSIAILATIFWAINPVQTQAVTYIVQRMASLAGMFYILSMYLYMRARTTDGTGQKLLFFISSFISFVMAFGSKENAVMLPVSLFLYEVLIVQEFTGKFIKRNLKGLLLVFGVTLLMGLTYLYYKGGNLSSFIGGGYVNRPFSLGQRLLTEPRIIIFYISLLIYPVPHRLSIAHDIQISTSLFHPIQTVVSIIFVFGAIAYSIVLARKYPLFSFCFLFFFLNHLIESTIFPLELIFEHRNYFPSMFFFVPVAIGFCNLLEHYEKKKSMQFTLFIFIAFLLIGLGHSTFIRNFTWKNPKSLWIDASQKAPDQFRVHHNLGLYFQDNGYEKQAIKEYEKALKSSGIHRKDEKIITYHNLGKLYREYEDYEKAEFYYKEAIGMKSTFSDALIGLALVYDKKGENELFREYLMKAIKANPGDPYINFNMGLYFLKTEMPDKAIYHFRISMKDEELKKRGLLHLGIAYKQKGSLGKALIYFRESARADERNISPHLYLAEIFCQTGNETMARQEAKIIVDFTMHNEALFYQTIDLISSKGRLGDVQLCARVLIPLISRAYNGKTGQSNERKVYMKKILEKQKGLK